MDSQTDRQKLDVFGRPAACVSCPSPTRLGMVMEDLEHASSCASKTFGGHRHGHARVTTVTGRLRDVDCMGHALHVKQRRIEAPSGGHAD